MWREARGGVGHWDGSYINIMMHCMDLWRFWIICGSFITFLNSFIRLQKIGSTLDTVTPRFFTVTIPINSISFKLCHHNGTTKNHTSVTARGIVRVASQMCPVRLISDTHPCVSLASQKHLPCPSQMQGYRMTWPYLEAFTRAHRLE